MSNRAGPEAAAGQIWMPGADRSHPAAHAGIYQAVAAGKTLCLPDEEKSADDEDPVGAAHQIGLRPAHMAAGQVLPGEFFLKDGTPAMIWPLLPTDAETLREGFRRLSLDSRQRRFLATLGELDDPMIRLLVDSVDGVRHIALLLIVLPPEGEEEPAGVAHLVQNPDDPTIADIAVTVADDWQGRGAGTALAAELLQRRPAAVTRLRTLVAAGNRASLALLAGAGRVSSGLPEQGVLEVTVELPWPPGRVARRRRPLTSGRRARGSSLTRLTCSPGCRRPARSRRLNATSSSCSG